MKGLNLCVKKGANLSGLWVPPNSSDNDKYYDYLKDKAPKLSSLVVLCKADAWDYPTLFFLMCYIQFFRNGLWKFAMLLNLVRLLLLILVRLQSELDGCQHHSESFKVGLSVIISCFHLKFVIYIYIYIYTLCIY